MCVGFVSRVPFRARKYHTTSIFIMCKSASDEKENIDDEIKSLLARAKAIRESIPVTESGFPLESSVNAESASYNQSVSYRLYLDVGREPGTWMDPKWGLSGNRVECTADVHFRFGDESLASKDIISKMVKDNFSGSSSPVRLLVPEANFRLRRGFDKMECRLGGYRIDCGKSSSTVRFYMSVDGTSIGDVSIPKGEIYFSIPCFGASIQRLSSRDGIISVRQVGWHTGFRREESRIIGSFRAVPLDVARKKDQF